MHSSLPRIALALPLLLAALLRLSMAGGAGSVWHPDEGYFVYRPLSFFGGDLNPHLFNYPSFYFYLLALLYLLLFLLQYLLGAGLALEQWVVYHYFWHPEKLLLAARLLTIALAAGTVGAVCLLAARLRGLRAGLIAGFLLALSPLHLRQSPLAAVDLPMTFFFLLALLAALRLGEREALRAYLVAGLLVGLAGAAKYPGCLAGAAVLAAHLGADRPFFDRRLWLAGLASALAFVAASPYVLLDFQTFWLYFARELHHQATGHGQDLGAGWWYHLHFTLRHSLGWAGLALALGGLLLAARHRSAWPLLAAALAFYLLLGSSRAVFARYALPLVALQAVFAAWALDHLLARRWAWLLVALALAGPLHGAVSLIQVARREDTRLGARRWIEARLPQGSALCNFGGWYGDVPLRTFEGLWWQVWNFENAFPAALLDRNLDFLARTRPPEPFYSSVIDQGGHPQERGHIQALDRHECAYVLLHRHPLSYSRVDSAFARQLPQRATRIAVFSPAGLRASAPLYDPLDAYYLPLARFGELERPGPEIEVWKVGERAPMPRAWPARALFARAYAAGASVRLVDQRLDQAEALCRRALALDAECAEALYVLALVHQQRGQYSAGLATFDRLLDVDPARADAHFNLGLLHQGAGRLRQALESFEKFTALKPAEPLVHYHMGALHYQLGEYELALSASLRGRALDPQEPGFLYNQALALSALDRAGEAIAVLDSLLTARPQDANAHYLLGHIHSDRGGEQEARRHYRQVLELDPAHPRAAAIRHILQQH